MAVFQRPSLEVLFVANRGFRRTQTKNDFVLLKKRNHSLRTRKRTTRPQMQQERRGRKAKTPKTRKEKQKTRQLTTKMFEKSGLKQNSMFPGDFSLLPLGQRTGLQIRFDKEKEQQMKKRASK